MSCNSDYTPRFQKQLVVGDPMAGFNCTAYSAAMAVDYATCGKKDPTGEDIRNKTGDHSGGLRLSQAASAAAAYGVTLTPHYNYPFDDFVDQVRSGKYALLQGWYDPIRQSRYAGSDTFFNNHCVGVPPGFEAQDPLADGRRNLYQYHKEVYPLTLLREFAGKLNISRTPDRSYVGLGQGYVYCAFTIAHDPVKHANFVTGLNKMIVSTATDYTVHIKKGQAVYREARSGSPIVTHMSKDADVPYVGLAGNGFRAIRIGTKAPFNDGLVRPVIAYVPSDKVGDPKK